MSPRVLLPLLWIFSLLFNPSYAGGNDNTVVLPPTGTVKKYALVIGNSAYVHDKSSLKNPVNDAKLMAQSLHRLGFDVKQYTDLTRAGLVAAVADFSSALPTGSTALVFYAGHGMQIGGLSYLIPVDMTVTSEQSVPLRAYPVKTLLEQISAAKSSVNVMIFDACRDNPFQPPAQYRNFNNLGLAPIQAPRGTVVAYSTAPGQLAADGKESNSFYTATLAKVIQEPSLTLEEIFKKVGNEVRKKTQDDQIPWFESSLTEEYFFLPPAGVVVVAGRPLVRETKDQAFKIASRGVEPASRASDVLWFRSMADSEWAELEQTLKERVVATTLEQLPMLKHQADGGSVIAQTTLGRVLRAGLQNENSRNPNRRVDMDSDAALQWFQKAADSGFPIAQLELGEMLLDNRRVGADRAQARRWLELAAKTNYSRAQLRLLKLGIEDNLVNRRDVAERLIELENRVQALSAKSLVVVQDESSQKEAKQRSMGELRKELALRGQKWSNADFGEAVMNGDIESVRMYLDAGWNPLSLSGEGSSGGSALAHFIWLAGNLDVAVIEGMLTLFVEHGVDPNAPVVRFRGSDTESMALNAALSCNGFALEASIKLGAITSRISESLKRRGFIEPPPDSANNCESQIPRINSLLKMQFRCKQARLFDKSIACELL